MKPVEDDLGEFRVEATELLETAESSLLSLEQGGEFKSNFDSIFRVFHNLKGASGMLGLEELGVHMHQLENLLNTSQSVGSLTKDQIDIFLKGVDRARELLGIKVAQSGDEKIASVPESQSSGPIAGPQVVLTEGLREYVGEAQEIASRAGLLVEHMEKNGFSEAAVDSLYRDIHNLKGGAHLFELVDLGQLNHALESVLDGLRQNILPLSQQLISAVYEGLDTIELLLLQVLGQPQGDLHTRTEKSIAQYRAFLDGHVELSPMPKLSVKPDEVVTPSPEASPSAAPPPDSLAPTPAKTSVAASSESDKDTGGTIRVPVSLLDKLMALMGEMVLVRNQVIQYASRTEDLEFQNLSKRLNVITGEIQGEMMKTRMQPIGNVMTKFSRLTRELSKELSKKIDLQLSGTETELDKSLLEAVKDPLTHIVRNSCDHGIEMPHERKACGKPESGSIRINSFHEGGQVIIEIADDGKGLHRDKLLKKAIEKGIVAPDKASSLSDREIINLIFAPGFSTAAKVTNVSGRGVGMDVVRTNIEKIGGTVEIESDAGRGTTMRLKIPLTLAIVPAMVVRCESDLFAIPQLNLVELVRVERGANENQIEYVQGHPVYRLRGNILSLIGIRKVLGLPDVDQSKQDVTNIVVLKSDQNLFGLIVDEIQDTADIVVKPLARFLKNIEVFSGATVMGDGAIALILDVAGIAKTHLLTQGDLSRKSSEIGTSKRGLEDIQDFLLLKVSASAKHAILLGYVHRLEEFEESKIEVSGHQRLVRYRNSVLPLISMDRALGLSDSPSEKHEIVSVVVIEKGGAMYGLEVSDILDIMSTEAQLDTGLSTPNGVIGNLITADEIVVVVDPYKLIQNQMGLGNKTLKSQEEPIRPAVRSAPKTIKNILYVEDAAFFRKHVSGVLKTHGFQVTLANNGKEAFELLEKSNPADFDLILSDIEMPQMNGFKFAEAVRSNKTWQHVPLIALSTRSDQRHVDEGFRCGFNAYLEKMNSDELVKSIAQMSNRGAA
jgi:two-component system chemotaxis sensor kinase CheA